MRRLQWVNYSIIKVSYFIADHFAIWSQRATLQAYMPIHIVCCKKGQRNTSITGSSHMISHSRRPVFIMASNDEESVLEQGRATLIGIYVGCIRDVISGALQPAQQIVLVEKREFAHA